MSEPCKRAKRGFSSRSLRRKAWDELDDGIVSQTGATDAGWGDDSSSEEETPTIKNVSLDFNFAEDGVLDAHVSVSCSVDRDSELGADSVQNDGEVDDIEWFDALDYGNFFDCEICVGCKCTDCGSCIHDEGGACVHCDRCVCDSDFYDIDEEDGHEADSGSEDDYVEPVDVNMAILNDFVELVINQKLNHQQISALLVYFRKWKFGLFPKCAKTLLKTPSNISFREVKPGYYWHRGVQKDLERFVLETNCEEVHITFGIDGLPLAKSSGSCFWPILCYFNDSSSVVVVGVYYGTAKPDDSNDFMKDFFDELKVLCQSGVNHDGRVVPVYLSCVICDAPAKSFLLYCKGHNAYQGCTRCVQRGKMIGRRMTYPSDSAPLRTDESFANQEQRDFHTGRTKLLDIQSFGPVSSVVLDYQHLVLLGTMRKVMYLWLAGPLKVRLSARLIENISNDLVSLAAWTPCEFGRRPRSLKYLKRFKATEYRLILLYIGALVFKTFLRHELYQHFLVLHTAMYILAHPKLSQSYSGYARDLLKFWVARFKKLYGYEYVSHNVHGLIHIADDVERRGNLDRFSAFKFENFLQTFKRMIRKGEKPLEQFVRRFTEAENVDALRSKPNLKQDQSKPQFSRSHSDGPLKHDAIGPQYSMCKLPTGVTINTHSDANNCCTLVDNSVIVVKNFAYSTQFGCMAVIGKKFQKWENLYEYPCESSLLGIKYVHRLGRHLEMWPVSSIGSKCFRMPHKDGFVVVPLLHS